MRPLVLLSVVFVAAPATAAAQDVAIPGELVQILLGGASGSLVVGRLPDGVPPGVIPPGAQPLGGMRLGERVTAVFAVPDSPEVATGALLTALASAGWQPVEPAGAGVGGFTNAPMGTPGLGLCRDNVWVTQHVEPRQSVPGSLVRLDVTRVGRGGPCDLARSAPRMATNHMPPLYPPAEARMIAGSGLSGGSDGWMSSARLETRLSLDELMAHYGLQLTRAGWTTGETARSTTIRTQTWRFTAEDQPYRAVLIISALADPAQRELLLRTFPVDPPRR